MNVRLLDRFLGELVGGQLHASTDEGVRDHIGFCRRNILIEQ